MIKLRLKYHLIWLQLLLFINLKAQEDYKPYGVEETFHYGFIMPHRKVVNELLEGHTKAYELSFFLKKSGKNQWEQLYNYPRIGASLIYLDLANPSQLGKSFGLFPYLSFDVTSSKVIWEIKFGSGLGYIEKSFDKTTNYKNLAIGSKLNAIIYSSSKLKIKVNDFISASTGISLIHFSNGSYTRPNLGINILSLNLGLTYSLGEAKPRIKHEIIDRKRTWSKNITTSFGVKEIPPVEGPKYFVGSTSFNVMKIRSNKSSFGAGIDIFYNSSLTHLIAQDTSKLQSNFDNFKVGATLIYSLDFGRFSALLQMGAYFFDREKKQGLIYHRVTTRYRINENIFFNLGLKTHYAVADYIELGIGYQFN